MKCGVGSQNFRETVDKTANACLCYGELKKSGSPKDQVNAGTRKSVVAVRSFRAWGEQTGLDPKKEGKNDKEKTGLSSQADKS